MQLKLRSAARLAALLVLCAPGLALAQTDGEWRANADLLIYSDVDNVQAYSPQLGVQRAIDDDGGAIGGSVNVDVVSAASVDVVSHATSHFRETRVQGEVFAAKAFGEGDHLPRLGYRFSREPDYISHTGSLSLTSELGTSDSVLAASYAFTGDTISRSGSPRDAFRANLFTHTATVGLTQVITSRLVLRGVYTFTGQWGYMEKVYRYVPLFTPGALDAAQAAGGVGFDNFDQYRSALRPPEEVPDRRLRHAFAIRGLYYFPSIHASLRVDYQLYLDDWDMRAHTIEPALRAVVRRRWEVGGWARVYRQNGASFWRRTYTTDANESQVPQYRTADRDLSPYTALTLGARLGYRGERWRVYGEASAVETLYDDFLYRDTLTAMVFQLGFEVRR